MVELSIAEGKLSLHVKGSDKLWSFQSNLEIPLKHIAGVGPADPDIARGWLHGLGIGTFVPGVITAGSFYRDGNLLFWDVHHPDKAIIIGLHDERYNHLIVEVAIANPREAINEIQNALSDD